MTAPAATSEEVTELLGEHVDESIIERLVDTGATLEQIGEALDDLEHERRFSEPRTPSSTAVAAARAVLEELPFDTEETEAEDVEEDLEGLTIRTGEDLLAEP